MSKSFGTKFIVVNDVIQPLPSAIFGNGPWLHIATVVRGFHEYCCFKHMKTDKIYIERVDPTSPTLFVQIKDQSEWNDIRMFLQQKGILAFGVGKEIKVAKQEK